MSADFSFNQSQLKSILDGLDKLQKQLPSNQVAAQRRSGQYLAEKMRGKAAKMKYDGVIEKSIDWREEHGVAGGHVLGKTSVVVIGPGAKSTMPIHAPLMEAGSTKGWWPNMSRLGAWAARRIPMITTRQVYFIARSMAIKGMLSERNPRAGGDKGYHYVVDTFNAEGNPALQKVLDEGFGKVKSTLDGIRT